MHTMERASTRPYFVAELGQLLVYEQHKPLNESERLWLANVLIEEPAGATRDLLGLLRNHADPRLDALAVRILEAALEHVPAGEPVLLTNARAAAGRLRNEPALEVAILRAGTSVFLIKEEYERARELWTAYKRKHSLPNPRPLFLSAKI